MADSVSIGYQLEPISRFGRPHYRVVRRARAAADPTSAGDEIATLELNRRIVFDSGAIYRIERQGGPFSIDQALWQDEGALAGSSPLAGYRREHTGFLRWRHRLVVSTPSEMILLFRRRHWYGSPANVDIVRADDRDGVSGGGPLVMRAEKASTWRARLRADVLDASALPEPVVVFALNVLAAQDRAAASAAAASAGAVGV